MASLSKDALFSKKRKTRILSVPDLGGEVILSVMSGTQLDQFHQLAATAEAVDKKENRRSASTIYANVICLCVVDEQGNPLFTKDDIPKILDLQWDVLVTIAAEALSFNGLTVKSAEASEKNSVSGQTESSGSV